mmetsp:Transcript_29936/g.71866  ORF Transcript_29936/g.71866 Transcript_29936/m.71866 type:complete len:211 (+) Transcript_29936:563-1195(+)
MPRRYGRLPGQKPCGLQARGGVLLPCMLKLQEFQEHQHSRNRQTAHTRQLHQERKHQSVAPTVIHPPARTACSAELSNSKYPTLRPACASQRVQMVVHCTAWRPGLGSAEHGLQPLSETLALLRYPEPERHSTGHRGCKPKLAPPGDEWLRAQQSTTRTREHWGWPHPLALPPIARAPSSTTSSGAPSAAPPAEHRVHTALHLRCDQLLH